MTLTTIARAAEIGIGTLYRHFPTREDLVFELYRHDMDELATAADELLSSLGRQSALHAWLHRYAQFVKAKAGLLEALRSGSAHERFAQEAYRPVTEAISRLLAAGARAVTVRSGYTPADLLLATDGLYRLDPHSDWHTPADKLFDLVMAALRPMD